MNFKHTINLLKATIQQGCEEEKEFKVVINILGYIDRCHRLPLNVYKKFCKGD